MQIYGHRDDTDLQAVAWNIGYLHLHTYAIINISTVSLPKSGASVEHFQCKSGRRNI